MCSYQWKPTFQANLTLSPYSGKKMQAADSYEMLATGYQTIWQHIPEDTKPNSNSSLYY
jgi:hypothetical protein